MLCHRLLVTLLVTIVAAPVFAVAPGIKIEAATYCVQDLGAPPDQPTGDARNLVIFGMNNLNQIVGTYAVEGLSRAFLWEPGHGYRILGALPGHNAAEARSINDAGVVVGGSFDSNTGQGNSFIWDALNGLRLLETSLGGGQDGATDINARGEVVGAATTDLTNFIQHGFFRARNGEVFDIEPFPGGNGSTFASALNDRGRVVGADSGPAFSQAFIWDPHRGLRPLAAQPQSTSVLPHDINNFGVVVGVMSPPDQTRGFRFTGHGGLQDLGSLGGSESDVVEAYSINLWGHVVGASQVVGGAGRAFIWSERQGMRNLNDLIDPGSAIHPLLGVGKAISNLGAIAVEGISEDSGRGFLLTPRFESGSPQC